MWILTPLRTRAESPGIKDKGTDLIKHIAIDVFLLNTKKVHVDLVQLLTLSMERDVSFLPSDDWVIYIARGTSWKSGWDTFVCITCTCPHCWVSLCENWSLSWSLVSPTVISQILGPSSSAVPSAFILSHLHTLLLPVFVFNYILYNLFQIHKYTSCTVTYSTIIL